MPTGVFIPVKLTRKARKQKPAEFANRKTGHPIRGTLKTRLQSLYIPPAYKKLQVAQSATNKIQVVGKDTAGRTQYIYHDRYKAGLEKRKYANLDELGRHIVQIEKDNQDEITRIIKGGKTRLYSKFEPSMINSSKPRLFKSWPRLLRKSELIQIMIYMLRTYHFRIGCQKYAELYGSYGLSTLRPQHFKPAANGDINISFIGKKGVINQGVESRAQGKKLIELLLGHYKHLEQELGAKNTDYLFRYLELGCCGKADTGLITSDDIQDFFKQKYNIYATPKMFRTWYANYHMLEYLRDTNLDELMDTNPSKQKLATQIKKAIGEHVSRALNNTPAICRKNYINNRLLADITARPQYYITECQKQKTPEKLHKYLGRLLIGTSGGVSSSKD
jgi:DNA topoisomerase-1